MRSSWTGGETLRSEITDGGHGGGALALAVHRREEGALERLIEGFEKPLFNYAHKLLQNVEDAQEVVQDTFLRAHRALTRQYGADRSRGLALRPWLFRIARNLSYNRRRGKRRPAEDEALESRAQETRAQADAGAAIVRRIENKQELERLERAIARLPRDSRDLVFLRFIEEMSYAEISKTTGHGEASLRGKVFRSLKLLRRELTEEEANHAL